VTRRLRTRSAITSGLVLAVVVVMSFVARPAEAAPTHTISLGAPGVLGADLDIDGQTFDQVVTALGSNSSPVIPLPIAGLGAIGDIPVDFGNDNAHDVVTLITQAPLSLFPTGTSPFAGVPVELMLMADWNEAVAGDTNPHIVLAVRATNQLLSAIDSRFGEVAGLPSQLLELDDVVLAFASDPGTTVLDPSALPTNAVDFLGIDSSTTLGHVAGLLGDVDLASMPAISQALQYLGVDPADGVALLGSLGDSAALLFDTNAVNSLDPADFSLDGPLAVDSSLLPSWLQDRVPEFNLRLGPAPDHTPSFDVHDSFTIETPGVPPSLVTNTFDYDVSLAEAATLDVTIDAPSFTPPFGLDWMGPFDGTKLHLLFDDTANTFAADFDALVPITTPSPLVHIGIHGSDTGSAGIIDVDGDIPLDDAVDWLGNSGAFDASFTPSELASVVVHDLELTYDSSGGRRILGAFADTTLPTPSFITTPDTLDATLLLAVSDPDGDGAGPGALLAGLRVIDPTCTTAPPCIHLGTLLPFPAGQFTADLTVPAVNFVTVQPTGAEFDPTGLGPDATAFLADLLDDASPGPVHLGGALEMHLDVDLAPFADALATIGITPDGPNTVAHLHGTLDFSLGSLADGGTDPSLDGFELTAELPSTTVGPPPALTDLFAALAGLQPGSSLAWPSTGDWELFLRFDAGGPAPTDDTIEFGASLPDITVDLGDGDVHLAAEGVFAALPGTGDFSLTLSLRLAQTWSHPFGIAFLDILDAGVEVTVSSLGGTVSAEATLSGRIQVGTEVASASLILVGGADPSAELTVKLETTVTIADMLTAFGAIDFLASLPDQVKTSGFGPAELTVRVDGDGVDIDAVTSITAPLLGPNPLVLSFLFSAEFPSTGDPRFTIGVRPSSTVKLSDVLGVPIEPDFTLIGDGAELGFVFSTAPLDPSSPDRTQTLRDWFDPLLVDGADLPDIPAGVQAIGRLTLPDPIGDLIHKLGVQPDVQLTGTIPMPGVATGFAVNLYLVADPAALPWFIDAASLHLGLSAQLTPTPSISLTVGGSMTLLVKQGLDQDIANGLAAIGLDTGLPVATPNPASCPIPGGVIRPADRLVLNAPPALPSVVTENFCMDQLVVTVEGGISLEADGIELFIGGRITSANEIEGWHPFGIDAFALRQMGLDLVMKVTPPSTVTFEVGVLASIDIGNTNFSGALQMGVSITPAPTPIGFIATPSFGGVRASTNQLAVADLLALNQTLAPLFGAPPLPASVAAAIPNIALRNLEFSLSPLGVQRLCIPIGIVIRGDLYINPTNAAPPAAPNCDPNSFSPTPAPPDGALCPANKVNGCVAGVLLQLTPNGIIADGFLAGFDLNPAIPFRMDDLALALRLTLSQQYLRLSGGVEIGPPAAPLASGQLALSIEPTAFQFFGRLQILGFNAVVDAELHTLGTSDPLALLKDPSAFNPNLSLHIVFADSSTDLGGDPDLADKVADLTAPYLDSFSVVVQFIDDVLGDMSDGDPLQVLLSLPSRLEALDINVPGVGVVNIDVPNWLEDLAADAQSMLDDLEDRGVSVNLDQVLNGVHLNRVPGTWVPAARTCYRIDLGLFNADGPFTPTSSLGTVRNGLDGLPHTSDDECWTKLPLLLVPGVPGAWLDPNVHTFTVDFFKIPTRLEFPAVCIGFVDGNNNCTLFPAVNIGGVCATLFPAAYAGDHTCTLTEVKGQVEKFITDGMATLGLDVGGLNLSELVDLVRDFLADDDPPPLFALDCAEASLQLSLLGENKADLALDLTVFGQQFVLGSEWNFSNPQQSAADALTAFWNLATGAPLTSDVCSGVPADLLAAPANQFEPGADDPDEGAGGSTPIVPPPPPLVLSATVAPGVVVEGSSVTLDVSFNRALLASDGSRLVNVAWADGSTSAETLDVGEQGFSVAHAYVDDAPSGTSSDLYIIAATSAGVVPDTAAVRVLNARPNVTASLDRAAVNEGGIAVLTVGVTDVGVLDTHTVRIEWGDGTVVTVPLGTGSFSHTYVDDDPTGTTSDVVGFRATVTDDDRGSRSATGSVTIMNVAPAATSTSLSPTSVDEGSTVNYFVSFADPGTRDTHLVRVDWNHDGTFDSEQVVPAGLLSTTVAHEFADDDPTGTASDAKLITLEVSDDDTGLSAVDKTVTVNNVAPDVCSTLDPQGLASAPPGRSCAAIAPITVDEGGTVALKGSFVDPGLLDQHTVTITWGNPLYANSVVTLPVGEREFTATLTYGDNGPFTIGVTVRDDDLGSDSESAVATVRNVLPTTAINETGTVLADGPGDNAVLETATFLTRSGSALTLRANSNDPGSDDLTHLWDWDLLNRFDTSTMSDKSRVNPPNNDPFPSPSVQPRVNVLSQVTHTWTQPCMYHVGLSVTDDDSGSVNDDIWVVVTGVDTTVRTPGYWYNQYDVTKKSTNVLPATTTACYLEIVRHMSRVFNSSIAVANTSAQARDLLSSKPVLADKEIMLRQLMATWLNVAHGSLRWTQLVDTNGDKIADTQVGQVLASAEAARLNPASPKSQLLAWEAVLQRINGA
jgi:hypothetical protein